MNSFDLSAHIRTSLESTVQVDYYQILGVNKDSAPQEICLKYRDIALATHPALQHSNPNEAYRKFGQAAQAFDVLYDKEKKKIYDEYGEQRLKEGVLKDQTMIGKYKFTTDPEEVFEKFFGSKNVFEHLLDVDQAGDSHPIFKAQYSSSKQEHKVPNLVVPVNCTLTEIFNGCSKQVCYDKKVLTKDGKNTQTIKETKTLIINPGESSKSPLVYPQQGNCEPGYKQSMLIFSIVEVNEKNFRRQGDNLIYTATISLMDALDSKAITVKELNGELINLHFDQIISPQTVRTLEGRGMPIKGTDKRGDLLVRFNIQFPEELPFEKKKRVIQLLRA